MALKKLVFTGIPKKVERISDARVFTVRYGVNNKDNTALAYLGNISRNRLTFTQ